MPSSGLQLLGCALSLAGLAATIAATCKIEWKKYTFDNIDRYEGLWMSCRYDGSSATCEILDSLFDLEENIQTTRAVMIVGIFLSGIATFVSIVGMKCTRFMEGNKQAKRTVAMVGGIIFICSGFITMTITSWYVSHIVQSVEFLKRREFEFGSAVFVSWAGAVLSMVGGAFLCCRRCSGSGASRTPLKFQTSSHTSKSDYV